LFQKQYVHGVTQPVSLDAFFLKHMLQSSDAQCQISNNEQVFANTKGVEDYRAEIGVYNNLAFSTNYIQWSLIETVK